MSGQSSCASWFLSEGLLSIWIRIEADRTDHVVAAEKGVGACRNVDDLLIAKHDNAVVEDHCAENCCHIRDHDERVV